VRAIASGGGNCYFLALIIRRWLKKLIEIIAHAYFLGEGVMYLLQEARGGEKLHPSCCAPFIMIT